MKVLIIAFITAGSAFGVGVLYFQNRDQAFEINQLKSDAEILNHEISRLKTKLNTAQIKTRPSLNSIRLRSTRPIIPARDQMFQHLYQINGQIKRIKHVPGLLTVDDFEVLREDRFFELLGFLLDQDLVSEVQIPKDSKFIEVKKELIEFGLSSSLIRPTRGRQLLIKLNNFNN